MNKPETGRSSGNQASRAHHEAELLLAISHRLDLTLTLSEGVAAIVGIAKEEIDAEIGSLFFNDPKTKELFFFVAEEEYKRVIRIPNTSGIAGHVFTTGKPTIIHDPYSDERFNKKVDQETGFLTRSILCAPLKSAKGEIIGVAELLNKRSGPFTDADLALFTRMVLIGALALKRVHFPELRAGGRAAKAHFTEPMKRRS